MMRSDLLNDFTLSYHDGRRVGRSTRGHNDIGASIHIHSQDSKTSQAGEGSKFIEHHDENGTVEIVCY
jgi:hypothetical protein